MNIHERKGYNSQIMMYTNVLKFLNTLMKCLISLISPGSSLFAKLLVYFRGFLVYICLFLIIHVLQHVSQRF